MADTLNPRLSPRANVALLTLQLRAALREAEQAEQAEAAWDGEAAASQLRERLEPMVREQRRTFEVELWRARDAAAARVDAVRDELAARRAAEPPLLEPIDAEPMVDRVEDVEDVEDAPSVEAEPVVEPEPVAVVELVEPEVVASEPVAVVEPVEPEVVAVVEPEPVAVVELVEPEVVAVVEPEPVVEPVAVVAPEPVEVVGREPLVIEVDEVVVPSPPPHVVGGSPDSPEDTLGASREAWSPPAPERAGGLTADDVRSIVEEAIDRFAARQAAATPPPNQGMDPEAFSRAFAAAFGAAFSAMLDERIAALNAGPAVAPPWVRYQSAQPVEVKKSFWTNMWHADVMLSVLAAVIVLVILIAWST